MDPQAYKMVSEAHDIVYKSKGVISRDNATYLSGVLKALLVIYDPAAEPWEPENEEKKRGLFG